MVPYDEHRPPGGITESAVTVISGKQRWLRPILLPVVKIYLTEALVLEQLADSQALPGTPQVLCPALAAKRSGKVSVCL